MRPAPAILIVDDMPANLRLHTGMLKERGYQVRAVPSGRLALQSMKLAPPDLVLLDINMPGMNGFEVCERMKSAPGLRDIPVIFISALTSTQDKVHALTCGGADYVTKPFQLEEVHARVDVHLALRQAQLQVEETNRQLEEKNRQLDAERARAESLLRTVLPEAVVQELERDGHSEPRSFQDVTVMFADLVDFTATSSRLPPARLIAELNQIFSAFDDIIDAQGCERIKTIGDAYLAVCGMPVEDGRHASRILSAAQRCVDYLAQRNERVREDGGGIPWQMRVGVHSGEVIGAIVGKKRFLYDIFGDAVNTASRMETAAQPMRVNVSEATYRLVDDAGLFEPGREEPVKGKGRLRMYCLRSAPNLARQQA